MSTVELPTLVTIPNVELLTTGEWNASSGVHTFTENDLRSAIAALDDAAVKAPRLRIGHTPDGTSPDASAGGFAEQPAFGRFANLRLSDNGQTIVADMIGVPAWLAEILPAAFPSRSIEGFFGVTTATGKRHDFVLTSVALLGVSMPAVATLEDLRLAYGDEMPAGVEFVEGTRVAASRGAAMPERVSASVQYEDVRRSFYEDFATEATGRYWWWIHSVVISPAMVIADDDEGGLWSVPFTLASDAVTWGDPVEVRIQYVEKDGGAVAATRLEATGERVLASAAESRPHDRVRAATTTDEGGAMPVAPLAILERLGLPEDATEDQMLVALDAQQANEGSGDGAGDGTPEGEQQLELVGAAGADAVDASANTVTVSREVWEGTNTRLSTLEADVDARRQREDNERRDGIVAASVRAGQIMPSERDHYRGLLDVNEERTVALLSGLAAGRVPVTEQGGAPSPSDTADAGFAALMSGAYGITIDERKAV